MNFESLLYTIDTPTINYDWVNGSPDPSVPNDNFSALYLGDFQFEEANYIFTVTADDGVRLYIDGTRVIDAWNDHSATTYRATVPLTAGVHHIKMEYYENGGQAVAKLAWVGDNTIVEPQIIPPVTETPQETPSIIIEDIIAPISSTTLETINNVDVSINDIVEPVGNGVQTLIEQPIATEESITEAIQTIIVEPIIIAVRSTFSVVANVSIGTARLTQNAINLTIKLGKTSQKKLASLPVSPEVSAGISTLAVAPTVLFLQYSLSTQAIVINSLGSMTDVWYMILSLFQGLLTALGLRTKRRHWGTVYDSRTKQPIDPAIVELIDAISGKVLDTSITDLAGRFGFLDERGSYRIRVKKIHYAFPSEIVTGTTDSIFENVYHGEVIEISNLDALLTPNIPMDSVAYDWNQEAKQKILKFHPGMELVLHTCLNTLFWLGFAFIVFNLIVNINLLNTLFALLYTGLIFLRKFIPNAKLWGRVESRTIDTAGLLLEISSKEVPETVVARAMTNQRGKFFLKASKGEYVLRVKKIGDPNITILETQVFVGKNGVVNKIIKL
jgi:hypothetical protein